MPPSLWSRMRAGSLTKLVLPPGPVLVVTLLGLILLSGGLYTRAIRAQRFLEPTLAIFQPRFQFYSRVERLLVEEFGAAGIEGFRFRNNSILVRAPEILGHAHNLHQAPAIVSLGRIFQRLLEDPSTRVYISSISVSPRVALTPDPEENLRNRLRSQSLAEIILNGIFTASPDLELRYATYFESSATSLYAAADEADWIEFRITPSEQIHVDVLLRLQKYIPSGRAATNVAPPHTHGPR